MTAHTSHTPCDCGVTHEGGYGDYGQSGRYSIDYCPLHAAAAELLEALEALMLNRELGELESRRQGKPSRIEVTEIARAAIRHARGEGEQTCANSLHNHLDANDCAAEARAAIKLARGGD